MGLRSGLMITNERRSPRGWLIKFKWRAHDIYHGEEVGVSNMDKGYELPGPAMAIHEGDWLTYNENPLNF